MWVTYIKDVTVVTDIRDSGSLIKSADFSLVGQGGPTLQAKAGSEIR
jgi:hypothetical protein